MHELHALVETRLVVPVQVREVVLDPPQPALAERLRLVEQERVTAKVVTDVAQVGRGRVRAATEVEVVWQTKGITQELRTNQCFIPGVVEIYILHEGFQPCS